MTHPDVGYSEAEAHMLVTEEVVEIRVLRRQGKSIREIARILDVSRNTVRRYLRASFYFRLASQLSPEGLKVDRDTATHESEPGCVRSPVRDCMRPPVRSRWCASSWSASAYSRCPRRGRDSFSRPA